MTPEFDEGKSYKRTFDRWWIEKFFLFIAAPVLLLIIVLLLVNYVDYPAWIVYFVLIVLGLNSIRYLIKNKILKR